ncbi:carboxymuconolactone decarboxylase family protein [Arthrobacter sp. Y81]|uniref:carboxymuconolactone decarboxylase family protein n=1 Tax=Arthrobacter sp. Y81 TaxID=2058897 RepID=UPI0035BE2B01
MLAIAEAATQSPLNGNSKADLVAARSLLGDLTFMAAEWVAATTNAFNGISILSEHQVRPRDAGREAALTIIRDVAPCLRAGLRLRVAPLSPCSYGLILHTAVARNMGLNAAKAAHLASWRESTMFAEGEGAALAYTEALTAFDVSAFAEHHERLARFFDEKFIAEFAAVVINMNVWTRLKLAQVAVPVLDTVAPNDVGRVGR